MQVVLLGTMAAPTLGGASTTFLCIGAAFILYYRPLHEVRVMAGLALGHRCVGLRRVHHHLLVPSGN
jgi:hypothetical protein